MPERDDRLVRPNARWHENLAGGDARPDVRCHVRKTRARLGRGRREKCPREAERVRPRRHQHPDGFLLLCCRGARCKILGFSRLRTTGCPPHAYFGAPRLPSRENSRRVRRVFGVLAHRRARSWSTGRLPKMGARRVMYWRQPPDRRTMQNYLELARAVSSRLNALDARETRWSAEVTTRRRANEPDAPGMFVSITAKDVAEEVFHVTLDASGGSGSGSVATGPTEQGSKSDRSVLVLRAERRCVAEPTPVREYLHRCARSSAQREDRAQFWSGGRGSRGEGGEHAGHLRGRGAGISTDPCASRRRRRRWIVRRPPRDALPAVAAKPARRRRRRRRRRHRRSRKRRRKATAPPSEPAEALVAVPASTLAAFGLEDRPFGDAAAATLYVACVMCMQS